MRRKNNSVHAFSALIHLLSILSLVNPDSSILMPKDGLRWRKLLVKLALSVLRTVPLAACGIIVYGPLKKHEQRCLNSLQRPTCLDYTKCTKPVTNCKKLILLVDARNPVSSVSVVEDDL